MTTVKGATSATVHEGKRGRFAGTVVTACNGRTMEGYVLPESTEATCKRCLERAAKQGLVVTR